MFTLWTILAAHSIGLGATMIGIVHAAINKVHEVRKIFKIPEKNEAIMSVIIGYSPFSWFAQTQASAYYYTSYRGAVAGCRFV